MSPYATSTKSGSANALPLIVGNLFVGDTIGGNDADQLQYGSAAGTDQISGTTGAVIVLSSGKVRLKLPHEMIQTGVISSPTLIQ